MNRESVSASAEPIEVSRRAALKIMAVGTLGAIVGAASSAFITRLNHAEPAQYHFFSQSEASLLLAICEQIIPRDDTPGATDAGVIHFIDRQLRGALSRHQQNYRAGLEALPQLARIARHSILGSILTLDSPRSEAKYLIMADSLERYLWSGTDRSGRMGGARAVERII